jgi:hypothetical protein
MATRTVRLDEETEEALDQIRAATGLRVSEALKRGIRALRAEIARDREVAPWDIYREIELGRGGEAKAPSNRVKGVLRTIVRRKTPR